MATRSTNAETEARCEEAADLLAEGHPGRWVVKHLATKYNVSPQSARAYVRKGEQPAPIVTGKHLHQPILLLLL